MTDGGSRATTDGSTQSYTLTFNDWVATTAATNSEIVTTSPSNVQPGNGSSRAAHIYADAIPLTAGKTVRSITLPVVSDGIVGTPQVAFHVFALGVG